MEACIAAGAHISSLDKPMIKRLINLYKLWQILKERGNWRLIRHSKEQLTDFIFCRKGLNKRSLLSGLVHWFRMLKGLDVLVWRLETFGFLYQKGLPEEDRQRLNRCLPQ